MRSAIVLTLCVPLLAGSAWLMRNDAVVGEGQRAFQVGKFGSAAAFFQKAMAGDGNRHVLQFNLGTALAEQGRRATDPNEASRLLRLAMVALRSALDASEPALRRNSHFKLGNTLVWAREFDLAIEHYRVVLREDPRDDEARYNLELALLLRDSELSLNDVDPKGGQGDAEADNAQASGEQDSSSKAGTPSEGQGQGGQSSEPGTSDGDQGVKSIENNTDSSPAPAMRAEPRAMREAESSQSLGIEEKLDALERRSGELRRGRVLRRTKAMRRARLEGAK